MTHGLQPFLFDDAVVLSAPAQAWSDRDGDMVGGSHGFFVSDVRYVSRLSLVVGGAAPEHIASYPSGAVERTFVSLARNVDDRSADPKVRVERRRTVSGGRLVESVTLSSALPDPVRTSVALRLCADLARMYEMKAGLEAEPDALPELSAADGGLRWGRDGRRAALVAEPAARVSGGIGEAELTWDVTVPARGRVTVSVTIDAANPDAVVVAPAAGSSWTAPDLRTGDSRLAAWVRASLDDLHALRLAPVERPDRAFLAAGAPWFFTLFGRDSLWAARFLLPLGTTLAADTLRVLAGLQGTRVVDATAEQPGKIMHELRPETLLIPGEGVELPPLYFGTVDATALWVCLLHDAWRWGMPDDEVRELLPALEAALAWMRDYGDSDGDGFLEYVDSTGTGLANQGWKDSGDSIQWRDGSLAEGPIALCEVQGYAYEAAMGGAALLDHLGSDGAGTWRDYAADLKQRFADRFWIDSPAGAYPAIALDAEKRRVDTVTSNIGHLLGTGILQPGQAELIAARLASPELNSGYGLRTMSTDSAGYWPLSYHGGSVWAHDTAIAILGLGREGFPAEAAALMEGLLTAAAGFGYRMPELHSGDAAADVAAPVPYPAACRPQAWSAASAVAVLSTALGLRPDAQNGSIAVEPIGVAATGSIHAEGLTFAGAPFSVTVDASGATVSR